MNYKIKKYKQTTTKQNTRIPLGNRKINWAKCRAKPCSAGICLHFLFLIFIFCISSSCFNRKSCRGIKPQKVIYTRRGNKLKNPTLDISILWCCTCKSNLRSCNSSFFFFLSSSFFLLSFFSYPVTAPIESHAGVSSPKKWYIVEEAINWSTPTPSRPRPSSKNCRFLFYFILFFPVFSIP